MNRFGTFNQTSCRLEHAQLNSPENEAGCVSRLRNTEETREQRVQRPCVLHTARAQLPRQSVPVINKTTWFRDNAAKHQK